MELYSCEHPYRIKNKYTNEDMMVHCGKCPTCKKHRASHYVALLEQCRMYSLATFFVTLTYKDSDLPMLMPWDSPIDDPQLSVGRFSKEMMFYGTHVRNGERCLDDFSIPFSEFEFVDVSDLSYFRRMFMLRGGIPYAAFSDVRLFNKRLNKYLKNHATHTFKNFSFFCVSEYGSTTHRPHFHLLYFLQDERAVECFKSGVDLCWQHGRTDTQYVESSACSYVAQYLNCLWNLPSFYQHRKIRPHSCGSKFAATGISLEYSQSIQTLFDDGVVTVPCRRKASDTKLSVVPLYKGIENRLYPKFVSFKSLSHSLRVELFELAERFREYDDLLVFNYKNHIERLPVGFDFKPNRFDRFFRWFRRFFLQLSSTSELFQYLDSVFDHFDRPIEIENRVRRFYYIIERVRRNCLRFGVGVDYYVRKMEDYFLNKEMYCLKEFYKMQVDVSNNSTIEELPQCWPIFADDNESCLVPKADLPYFRRMVSESEAYLKKYTKSHFKNAYFESLEIKDKLFYKLIKDFYYAKECNEIVEALAA